ASPPTARWVQGKPSTPPPSLSVGYFLAVFAGSLLLGFTFTITTALISFHPLPSLCLHPKLIITSASAAIYPLPHLGTAATNPILGSTPITHFNTTSALLCLSRHIHRSEAHHPLHHPAAGRLHHLGRYREARHNTRPVAPSGLQVSFLLCSTLTSAHTHNGHRFLKPLLTHCGPPLTDTLPQCCGLFVRLFSCPHVQEDEEQVCEADPDDSTFDLEKTEERFGSEGGDSGSAHQEDLLEGDLGLGTDPPAIA
ncbi:hypothetical protein F7725_029156, partial [Dissostichus mawsoni]